MVEIRKERAEGVKGWAYARGGDMVGGVGAYASGGVCVLRAIMRNFFGYAVISAVPC